MSIIIESIHLVQGNRYEKDNPVEKCTKDLCRHFAKEDRKMANEQRKRCSKLLLIMAMKLKLLCVRKGDISPFIHLEFL